MENSNTLGLQLIESTSLTGGLIDLQDQAHLPLNSKAYNSYNSLLDSFFSHTWNKTPL